VGLCVPPHFGGWIKFERGVHVCVCMFGGGGVVPIADNSSTYGFIFLVVIWLMVEIEGQGGDR